MWKIHVAIAKASAVHYLWRRFTFAVPTIRLEKEDMTSSLKEIRPVVVMPQADGGKIEITVDGDTIWLSDYSDEKTCNFTLCIRRGELEGDAEAPNVVHQVFQERMRNGKRTYQARRKLTAEAIARQPPSKAGYWFIDPTISPHGGPVVVMDP
jgi:hypothetical protein